MRERLIGEEKKKYYKGILAIDFDNTIASTTYPEIHGFVKNSKKYINKLYDDGWYIIIWTCRDDRGNTLYAAKKAKEWLKNNNVKFNTFNENHSDLVKRYGESRKVSVDFYIDDKHIFGIPSWRRIYNYLNKLENFKSCLYHG